MSIGPGRYDELGVYCCEKAEAEAAIVMIFRGNKGDGFSLVTRDWRLLNGLPDVLENMAEQLREDLANMARPQ